MSSGKVRGLTRAQDRKVTRRNQQREAHVKAVEASRRSLKPHFELIQYTITFMVVFLGSFALVCLMMMVGYLVEPQKHFIQILPPRIKGIKLEVDAPPALLAVFATLLLTGLIMLCRRPRVK